MSEKQQSGWRRDKLGRAGLFLLLTFGLSWGVMLSRAALTSSHGAAVQLIPAGMLIPAGVALALQTLVWRDTPLYLSRLGGWVRLVILAYIGLAAVGMALQLLSQASVPMPVLSAIGQASLVGWTLLVLEGYKREGEDSFAGAGLQLGNRNVGARFILGAILFLLAQALFNAIFQRGQMQGVQECIAGVSIPRPLYPLALAGYLSLVTVGTPLGSLAVYFGEEYGWRGFLTAQLEHLGRRRAAVLIGLIWGVWHIPILASGIHTYPPTAIGYLLAGVFFVLWGVVQSYAVLKTGSIWVAAFLQGVVNGVYAFSLDYLVRPHDKLASFGLGVYGLACLLIVVLLILRDPAWEGTPPVGKSVHPGLQDDGLLVQGEGSEGVFR